RQWQVAMQTTEDGDIQSTGLLAVGVQAQPVPYAHRVNDNDLRAVVEHLFGQLAGAVGLSRSCAAKEGKLLGNAVDRQQQIIGKFEGLFHCLTSYNFFTLGPIAWRVTPK